MLIDFKKLEKMGYKVSWDDKEKTVSMWSEHHNERAYHALGKIADMLEFNNSEHDDLTVACQNIQELKALKIAMGW